MKPSSSETTIISNQAKSIEAGETPQLKHNKNHHVEQTSEIEIYYNREQDSQDHQEEEHHVNAHFENGQPELQQTNLTGPAVITIDVDDSDNTASE